MFKWIKERKELKELKVTKLKYEVVILSKIFEVIQLFNGSVDTSALLEMADKVHGLEQTEFVKALAELIHSEQSSNEASVSSEVE